MTQKTTILLFGLTLMACQNSLTYSEKDMQVKTDSILAQQIIIKNQDIMIDNLMHNCNSFISELQGRNVVEADSYEYTVKGVSDSLQIKVNKDYLNVTILIVDGEKQITISYGNGRLFVNNPNK